ncbi:MAG: OB-fold nucleic acid binding domain-containing protein [Candidatus Parvarchaeota archaeon]|nr:OB-fold nucleic acid binding domain-containing protein [Candidatus Jingweiarchaeum tengchongense]MCW1298389.1 OB-fold nucleic acid binding domain-containing protein [Candidatus Jingweiarchaeum tengchongense]MCW1300309.1 OB-fold nucleic acid binding domain-containing protein [Candidatus Jingweiarchaeum tengchongense]MCW1304895.1 OB-fold nucleic acid binding domain-containing protein [Candidatus Jingweiarchaeum tengchongense]MCW1305805.1 OB-fold nucleic acid binding domain-containing protein [
MEPTLEEIIEIIKQKTGLLESEIKKKIEDKVKELSGLISEKGAALIIANELNIKLNKGKIKTRVLIQSLVPGLKDVVVMGRVLKIYKPREFEKGKIKGKVGGFLLGDETGKARVVIWDDRNKLIEQGEIKEGDIIKVISGTTRENKIGFKEIHLNSKSKIEINPSDEETKFITKQVSARFSFLIDTEPDKEYKIIGSIVRLVKNYPLIYFCPKCNSRLNEMNNKYCAKDGEINPRKVLIIKMIIDDGTATINAFLIGKKAEKLLDLKIEELYEQINKIEDYFSIIDSKINKLYGKSILFTGKIRKNIISGNNELLLHDFMLNPSPKIQSNILLKQIQNAEDNY